MTHFRQYIEVIQVLWPALLTAAALGMAASTMGVFVLLRREALVALAMPHVVAVGVAIGLRMGWPTLPPALVVAILALGLLVWSKRNGANNWILPSIYIGGLSISFLIIAGGGAHVDEIQNIFTGIDVAVSESTAFIAIPLLLAGGIVCALLWRRWLLLSQSPPTAEVAGLRPGRWDAAFLCLLAAILLIGTDALGTVLVIAMLFLPSATVLPWVRRVPAAMIGSAVISLLLLLLGLIVSIEWDYPLSQSVGGCGFAVLIAMHGLAWVRQ